MKLILFIISCTLIAGAQVSGGISNEVQPFRMPSHPATATRVTLYADSPYATGTGETPLWQCYVPKTQEPLGDVARRYRDEWKTAPKSKVRLEK